MLNSLMCTSLIFKTQHITKHRNRVAKHVQQHVVPNNVVVCCAEIMQ